MRDERIQQAEHLKPRVVLPVLLLAAAIGLLVLGIMSVSAAPSEQSVTTRPQLLAEDGGDLFLVDATDGNAVEIITGFRSQGGTTLTGAYPTYAHTFGTDGTLYYLRRVTRLVGSDYYYSLRLGTVDFSTTPPTLNYFQGFQGESTNASVHTGYGLFFLSGKLYAASHTNARVYELDPTSGGSRGTTCSGLGSYRQFAVVNNVLFAVSSSSQDLYRVDLVNCTKSVIGTTSTNLGPDITSVNSIAGHNGILYGIGVETSSPRDYVLMTIDTSTGIATKVSTDSATSPLETQRMSGRVLTDVPDDFFINTSGMSACVTSDAVDQGRLENSSGDFNGNFLNSSTSCLVESDNEPSTTDKYPGDDAKSPANIFSFQMASGRAVNITINPNTSMLTGLAGQYGVRVRTGGLDGPVVRRADDSYYQAFTIANVHLSGNINYYMEVFRYGVGGGGEFSVNLSYNYIQSPTPTVLPTATPAPVPNLDTRIDPEPNSRRYEDQKVYQFTVAGNSDFFPVTVRAGNAAAVKLSTTASTLNCALTSSELTNVAERTRFYAHICKGGTNSTLRVLRTSSNTETALYAMVITGRIFTVGGGTPTPGPPSNPKAAYGFGQRPDAVGITIFTREVCGAAGMSCNVNMIKDAFGLVGAAAVFLIVVVAGKGQSTFSYGLGFGLATVALMLGYLLIGLPLWYALTAILIITAATSLGVVVKVRRAV